MEGQADIDKSLEMMTLRMGLTLSPEEREAIKKETLERNDNLKKRMSPKGTLHLPPLLDERRLEWGIPDGAFRVAALYDRILLWQIPPAFSTGETIGAGRILKSDETRLKELRECPRGIIVSAGLKALDVLRSNGSDLGHIVQHVKNSVYGIQCDYDPESGKYDWLQVLRDGDLIGDEDLRSAVAVGVCKVNRIQEDGQAVVHRLVDDDGHEWDPVMPWTPDGD